MSTTARDAGPTDTGLRHGVMSGPELAAQAIANIAPSAVIAFTAAAIYLSAGRATILAFALATVAILAVGAVYALTQRRPDVIARIGKTETELLDGVG